MMPTQLSTPPMNPSWNAPMRSNAGPCPPRFEHAGADRVGDGDEGDQSGADVLVAERQTSSLTIPDSPGPRPGEAVGLLFRVDRRHDRVEVAGAELHGVAELVGHHDGDDRRAEPLGEVVDDAELAVVVGHEVAIRAVERPVVADLLVARRGEPTAGDRSVRSG